jgi:hypothetical protein
MDGVFFNVPDAERIGASVRAYEAAAGGTINDRRRPTRDRNYTRVSFRNDYAGTVPAYGLLRIETLTTIDGSPCFTVDRPDSTFNRLYLVNGPDDVAQNGFGWGTFLWHADWVLYDDASTPAFGESWGPQADSFKLKKWRHGFTIWGEPSGGDTDIVQASQMWANQFLAKSDEEIAADGGTGQVIIYDGNGATTAITLDDCVNRTGLVIEDDKWCKATWLGGKWYVEPWQCPA